MPSVPDNPPPFLEWRELNSLVGSIRTRSLVCDAASVEDCRRVLAYCRENGLRVCPRGAGRSYGDMALHDQQVVLDTRRMNRILDLDEESRRITVEAGIRLIDIFRHVHHKRLTLPSVPTESHSSVSGALCANINGKDGWRAGNFANQVVRIKLLRADGELITVERTDPLFDAVAGGMGLVGIVVEATLQLRPIPSPYVEVSRHPAPDMDALLRLLPDIEASNDLFVGWVDATAGGRSAGRSVIHAARWLERDDSEEELERDLTRGFDRLDRHRRFGLALHERLDPLLSGMLHLQRPLVGIFNRIYYAKCVAAKATGLHANSEQFLRFNFEASFTVPPAHLVCGPRGYTIQLTFPRSDAREAMPELLAICRESTCLPITAILRAHRSDDHLISFCEDGYSLNFEFHPKKRHEAGGQEMIDRLVDAIASRGGKIHLAKDQVLRPEQFIRLYPRATELLEVKRELDPSGMFTSDQARRLGMGPSGELLGAASIEPKATTAGVAS